MGKRILILGAGFGGLETAVGLREQLDPSHEITLIDKNDFFIFGFSKFDVMFGRETEADVKCHYQSLVKRGIDFVQDTITKIDIPNQTVSTAASTYSYDYLVVALGSDVVPEAIQGFVEGGYQFYTLDGAERLRPVIAEFTAGTLLISIFSKPYKCPPAPYEAAFQLHDLFVKKGIRDQIQMKMLIPSPIPLPIAKNVSAELEKMLEAHGIELCRKHKVTALDPSNKLAHITDMEPMPYDLFLGVPIHRPPAVIRDSVLGEKGWVSVDPANLRTIHENVYAIGDVINIPLGEFAVPKAGVFAEDGARAVVNDMLNQIEGSSKPVQYDAAGVCFLEFAGGQVAAVKANFLGATEPQVNLVPPTAVSRQDKENFKLDRIKRWFG